MKKYLFLLIGLLTFTATILPVEKAEAQFANFVLSKTTATTSGADTVTGNINYPASAVTSLTVTVTKASGTLAGTIYVYGSNLGNTYTLLDSATVTNTTGAKDYDFNTKTNASVFPVGGPVWYKYRFVYYQTGGSATLAGKALTRSR